jgi:hypothetical protein
VANIVDPVPAAAPSTSLLTAARPMGEVRWDGLPIGWHPERCITTQGFSLCAPVVGLPVDEDPGSQYTFPVAYRVRDWCTTLNGALDTERLRRQAEAVASFEVARELWTGALSAADPGEIDGTPYPNPALASAEATTVTATGTLAERLAALEEAARVAAKGQQVFLHLPIHMVTPIANLLRRVGNTLYTALDSVVIADAGYPGTGPAGTGTTWAYATGPVQVGLGSLELIAGRDASTVQRGINRQEIWAERPFATAFDPCVHFAVDTAAVG